MRRLPWLPTYCRLAGSVDLTTGLLLVLAPAFALRMMGVSAAAAEPIWIRWVGVFVGAVGLTYWLPDLLHPAPVRGERRIAVLEFTTLVRLAVASFVAWALGDGRLEPAFASVLATDLGLGVLQIAMLRRLAHRAPDRQET